MGSSKFWTEAERDYLESAWGSRSIPHIAAHLGRSDLARVIQRSQSAIKTRVHDLCLDVKPARTPSKPWSCCEDEHLAAMAHDGRTWDAIGNALGRTSGAVRARYEALQKGA